MVAGSYDAIHHGPGHLVAVFATGLFAGIHRPATNVLVDPAVDAACLCEFMQVIKVWLLRKKWI